MAEKMFWLHRELAEAVAEALAERSYYRAGAPTGGAPTGGAPTSHAYVSDPTASLAMKFSEPLKRVVVGRGTPYECAVSRPEEWLLVIRKTLEVHPEGTPVGEVLRGRYERNRASTVTCSELGINLEQYHRYKAIGIEFAKDYAIQLGLIRVV